MSYHASAHSFAVVFVIREGMLEAEECVPNDERCAAHRTGHYSVRRVEIDQRDFAHGNSIAERAERELLSDVVRAIAEDTAPYCLEAPGCILKRERYASTRDALGHPRRARIRSER